MFYDNTLAVIGSLPLSKITDLKRKPQDLDVICTRSAFARFISYLSKTHEVSWVKGTESGGVALVRNASGEATIIDAEFMLEENTSSLPIFEKIVSNSYPRTLGGFSLYEADLDMLYLLKMSHRYRKGSPQALLEKFDKTRSDILLMRRLGAKINDQELYDLRMKETYKYKHPALNVSKEDFFKDDGVQYVYDHDSLHEAVAIKEVPAYTKYLKTGSPVECDREKFESLSHEDKILGVFEEACVLALERAVIPYHANPEMAWAVAIRKVCTSITSGWFREFAWEHFDDVEAAYDEHPRYVDKFSEALIANKVKPFKESVY